eukprot:1339469-Rhodomonas_salina.1
MQGCHCAEVDSCTTSQGAVSYKASQASGAHRGNAVVGHARQRAQHARPASQQQEAKQSMCGLRSSLLERRGCTDSMLSQHLTTHLEARALE